MAIEHLLAVVPVSDVRVARQWYERLWGRAPDNTPMETLVEWQIVEKGWVQVFLDPERAGFALLNFAVDDLSRHVAELTERGFFPSEIETVTKGVQLSSVTDPDGNRITMIGSFRVRY